MFTESTPTESYSSLRQQFLEQLARNLHYNFFNFNESILRAKLQQKLAKGLL